MYMYMYIHRSADTATCTFTSRQEYVHSVYNSVNMFSFSVLGSAQSYHTSNVGYLCVHLYNDNDNYKASRLLLC